MRRPSGFDSVEAIFATCLVAATPTLQMSPVSAYTLSQHPGDLAGRAPEPPCAGHVEERLIDRERLDEGVMSWKIAIT
jgi:hypothetical protein